MQRTTIAGLAALGLGIVVTATALGVAKGGVFASRYEGDMLHLVEIILRIAQGQRIHADFMTPIGIGAVWPVAAFVGAGWGIGHAVILAQAALALTLLPAALWVAASRMGAAAGATLVAFVTVLTVALVHGSATVTISLSMHYNRWAWAVATLVLVTALLPRRAGPGWPDAVVLGVGLAALGLIKATYVAALLPGVLVCLLGRGERRVLAQGVAAGLVVVVVVTLWQGFAFWPGYLGDLLETARSDSRAQPSLDLAQVITQPAFLGPHIAVLAAVIWLRRAGRAQAGLSLLVFLPGLVFITWQNFGNDPLWLLPAALVLWSILPEPGREGPFGTEARTALGGVALALAAFGAPSILNLALSPLRNFAEPSADYTRMLPDDPQHDDLFTTAERAFQINFMTAAEDEMPATFARFASVAGRKWEPAVLQDEVLDRCELQSGAVAWFVSVARDLDAAGLSHGTRILTADMLGALWLFSPHLGPVTGDAPWRYGGVPGLDDATHVLVPLCPISGQIRADFLKTIDARADIALSEVRRTETYILLAVQKAAASAR